MLTVKEALMYMERDLRKCADKDGKISVSDMEREFTHMLHTYDIYVKESTPVKKLLFVEDGSVDTDELEELLGMRNPEVKVVVYRQGARSPELVDVEEAE